jgi:hypothetical protein
VIRIFVEGKNSSDVKIGNYDDRHPLYANPLTTPGRGFKPQGKVSSFSSTRKGSGTGSTFKNGKPRKTKWFSSFKSLKQVIGQESSFVNLEYTGSLKSDFSNHLNPLKVNSHEYIAGVSDLNERKIEGNEKRFGSAIVDHTQSENANFFDIATKEYNLQLKKAILGD